MAAQAVQTTGGNVVLFGVFLGLATFLESRNYSMEELAAYLLTMHNDMNHAKLTAKLARMISAKGVH